MKLQVCSSMPSYPRQLIGLALASVDYETDKHIQETISNEFRNQTILCIARLFLFIYI